MPAQKIHNAVDHQFHDASIYGLRLTAPEPERDDWRSELTLDIDFILEWIKSSDKAFRFRLVRADLRFLGVSDLNVKFGFPGVSIYPLPIDRIVRSDGPVVIRDEYREYVWSIELNDGSNGNLTFRATGYQLCQTGQPDIYDEQQIPPHERMDA